MSSQSIVSSSRTVRPYIPRGCKPADRLRLVGGKTHVEGERIFAITLCFEQSFMEAYKFEGAQKRLERTAPNAPSRDSLPVGCRSVENWRVK